MPNFLRRLVTSALMAGATLVAGVTLGTDALAAQRPGGPPPRAELQRRIQERFNEVVQSALGIGDDQAQELRALSLELMERRRALVSRHRALQDRLAGLEPSTMGAEADEVLAELRSVHRDEAHLVAEEIDRLLEVIEPAQVVQFYALRQRMMERVEARRGAGGGFGGGRPGGQRMRPPGLPR